MASKKIDELLTRILAMEEQNIRMEAQNIQLLEHIQKLLESKS